MLMWSVLFLIIAIVAALFGYTGIAKEAAGFARIIFFIAVILTVISLLFRLM